MKEQEPINGLTNPTHNPTLRREGEIFAMAEPASGEARTPSPEQTEQKSQLSPFTRTPDRIENPELRRQAQDLTRRIEEKSLTGWTTEDLKKEYLNWHALESRLEDEGTFGDREQIAADAQPYSLAVIEELQRRGEDVSELFKRAAEISPTRSVGAATVITTSFQEQVEALREEVQSPKFQAFLDRVKTFPADRRIFESIYNELQTMYQQDAQELLTQIVNLRRQRPEPTEAIHSLSQHLNQLREEFDRINVLLGTEGARIFSEERLPERIPERMRLFLGRDLREKSLTEEERTTLKNAIDEIEVSVTALPLEIIDLIVQDEELSEKYLDKLLSIPDSLSRLPYSLGFYGNINVETFLQRVKVYDRRGRPPEEAYRRQQEYADQRGMRERFHEMRRYMLEGNIGNFAEVARTIAPEYLQRAIEYVGVATVQRFYETAIKETLNRKQTLEPKDFRELDRRVQELLGMLLKTTFFRSGKYNRQLEEWEVSRALAVGKNFAVIKLRIPELISLGRISQETVSQIYASFDYESVIRLVNPTRWLGSRFELGAPHGGKVYLQGIYGAIDETNPNPSKIDKLFGLKRTTVERSVPLAQTGFDTGWRIMEAYLDTFSIRVPVSQREILDELEGEEYKIWVYEEGKREMSLPVGRYLQQQLRWNREAQAKKERFNLEAALTPLVDQVHFYRGLLVAQDDIPLKVKTEIWKKIARDLPNQIMLILKEDTEELQGAYPNINLQELENKLILFQERRVREKQTSLDIDTPILLADGGEESFTDEEKNFIKKLRELREEKAVGLAKVRWPYPPFFEDGTVEDADYLTVGAEAFRRRIADAGAIHEAGGELLETIQHPDMPFDTFMQHIEKAYNSIATPIGLKAAQDRVYPFIKGRFVFTRKHLWARLTPFLDDILGFFGVPLSPAQSYYGRKGDAQDAFGLRDQSEQLVGKGIVRRHKERGDKGDKSQIEELRNTIGATVWHIARERIPIGILLVLLLLSLSLGRSLVKEKTTIG